MKKSLTSFLMIMLVVTGYLFFVSSANADVLDPDYYEKECKVGEKEIKCSFSRSGPFGPVIKNECAKYQNNNNYYLLAWYGGSSGGNERYCLKSGAKDNAGSILADKFIITGGVIAVVAILSLIILYKIRKRNVNY